jgi:MarR family 2-MHQ and catechol resistance regulon transcriptional repressor
MGSSGRDQAVSRPLLALVAAEDRIRRALAEAIAPTGVTLAQFNVLMELAATPEGRLPLCDIGRRLIRSAPNITALIDRLEAARLVRRREDPSDRRVVLAEITEQGWKALDRAAPAVFRAERRIIGDLSAGDRRTLTRLLRELTTNGGS